MLQEAALTVQLTGQSSGDVVLIQTGKAVDQILFSGQPTQCVIDIGTGLHRCTTGGIGDLLSGEPTVIVVQELHGLTVAVGLHIAIVRSQLYTDGGYNLSGEGQVFKVCHIGDGQGEDVVVAAGGSCGIISRRQVGRGSAPGASAKCVECP